MAGTERRAAHRDGDRGRGPVRAVHVLMPPPGGPGTTDPGRRALPGYSKPTTSPAVVARATPARSVWGRDEHRPAAAASSWSPITPGTRTGADPATPPRLPAPGQPAGGVPGRLSTAVRCGDGQ